MGVRTAAESGLVAARQVVGERAGKRHIAAGLAVGVFTTLVATGRARRPVT